MVNKVIKNHKHALDTAQNNPGTPICFKGRLPSKVLAEQTIIAVGPKEKIEDCLARVNGLKTTFHAGKDTLPVVIGTTSLGGVEKSGKLFSAGYGQYKDSAGAKTPRAP